MNYTLSPVKIDKKTRQLSKVILRSKKHTVTLTTRNDHVHVTIKGKVRKRALTSVRANLTAFEAKCVAIHVYKAICDLERGGLYALALSDLKHCNYAEVFGSPWE
jgi:hypothetical protein